MLTASTPRRRTCWRWRWSGGGLGAGRRRRIRRCVAARAGGGAVRASEKRGRPRAGGVRGRNRPFARGEGAGGGRSGRGDSVLCGAGFRRGVQKLLARAAHDPSHDGAGRRTHRSARGWTSSTTCAASRWCVCLRHMADGWLSPAARAPPTWNTLRGLGGMAAPLFFRWRARRSRCVLATARWGRTCRRGSRWWPSATSCAGSWTVDSLAFRTPVGRCACCSWGRGWASSRTRCGSRRSHENPYGHGCSWGSRCGRWGSRWWRARRPRSSSGSCVWMCCKASARRWW